MMVLDTNAAIGMLLETDEGLALEEFARDENKSCAPSLFHAELAHVLEKYVNGGVLTEDEAQEKYEEALGLIDVFEPDENLAPEALHTSLVLKHSSYDMFFFVLARRLCARLYTSDKKLSNLCLKNGVDCIYQVKLPETLPENW